MFGGLIPFGPRNHQPLTRKDFFWDLRNMMDEFFNDSFFPAFSGGGIRADIRETDKEYIVEAELPGVNKEDIQLDVRDDILTITVERNEQINEERENYIRRERRYGSASRSFYLQNVKQDKITAKYKDGILTVVLPKQDDTVSKKRKIDIQ